MWRGTVFVYFLIFYGYTTSQPVTDDAESGRQARQLDFGECCPCPGADQADQHGIVGAGLFARARDLDDCPCRPRHADSEGASSIFFPSAMRSDGPFVRPADKEELKPLLHPEVDLASSVLQTLREATDEEYRDAVARDAARSIAKTAEETLFGDATPEASTGSIVTIIVNPKRTDSQDDITSKESHVQESRCVNSPLESARTDMGKIRIGRKPPNLLREIFGLPRISYSGGNLLDVDSGVGASNIQEHVVNVDDDQKTKKGIKGLRTFAPLMKIGSNLRNKYLTVKSNVDNDYSVKKVPDFKSSNIQNKLKDLISNKYPLGGIRKVNHLPLIPKMKIGNSLSKVAGKNNDDLSLLPSNIQEETIEKTGFFKTKSHLENILQRTGPVSLKNFLKLKDVELIPLKDMVNKATERAHINKPKIALPAIFRKRLDVVPVHKNKKPAREVESTEKIETFLGNSEIKLFDAEVSPSQVIQQISGNHCENQAIDTKSEINFDDSKDKISSNELLDTLPSPSDIQSVVNNKTSDLDNSQSDELTDNIDECDIQTLSAMEKNLPQVTERSWDVEIQDENNSEIDLGIIKDLTTENAVEQQNREINTEFNENDCVNNDNDVDSMTDSSNMSNVLEVNGSVLEKSDDSVGNNNIITEDTCSQEQQAGSNSNALDNNSITKLINPVSLDKKLSTIKDNIMKKIENLKNSKVISKNSNKFDRNPQSNIENKESFIDENHDIDCQNEGSIQITTVKPDICNENLENNNEFPNKISMEELQKISDSMLQEEEEKEREAKSGECSKPLEQGTQIKIPLEMSSRETEIIDSKKSAASQKEVKISPQDLNDYISDNNEHDIKNVCQSELVLPKQSLSQHTDANAEASEVVINRIPESSNIMDKPCLLEEAEQSNENNFNLLRGPLPEIQDIFKLAPLPTLDEITLRLTNLFDKNAGDVEVFSSSEADSMTDTSNILNPTMETEASTTNFQSRGPSLTLEDINLDILQLKPRLGLASKIPKIDLHSYKAKLPLPKDLLLKPIKLQSALQDRGSMLGATLSIGKNNNRPSDKSRKITRVMDKPLEILPNLDHFRTQMNTLGQKFLNIPLKNENFLGLSDLSENIHSNAKNTWRNMHRTLQSNFKEATRLPSTLKSYNLLEAISRNHEDLNDKLKALHMDFNDRIESMHNDIIDKSRLATSESRNGKPNMKSFSTFSKQKKEKPLSLLTSKPKSTTGTRESKKTVTPRKFESQRQIGLGSLQTVTANQKKFKMPTAASVPVPRTVEVPELKMTSTKFPGLGMQRLSGVNAPQTKESSPGFWKQPSKNSHISNPPLGKSINPFKESKIKVSFSTTPRPTIAPKLQSRTSTTYLSNLHNSNSGRNQGRFRARPTYEDHNGSPSEVKHSMISSPMSSHVNQHNLVDPATVNESRETERSYDEQMSLLKSGPILLGGGENSILDTQPRKIALQSWPKVSESAFLSKVREAVKARLTKVNPPITLKQSNVLPNLENSPICENEYHNSNADMARSASENIDVIEGKPLKENVSYKCRMVCTKEK